MNKNINKDTLQDILEAVLHGMPVTQDEIDAATSEILFRAFSPSTSEENKIPSNLDEAIAMLELATSEEDKEHVKTEGIGALHFGVGTNLRNGWGLWEGGPLKTWFESVGIFHPDDMSGVIFKAFRRKLLGYPYNIAEDVKYYQEFWKKSEEREKSGEGQFSFKATKNEYGETVLEYEKI